MVSYPYTWTTILNALRAPQVSEVHLAQTLIGTAVNIIS